MGDRRLRFASEKHEYHDPRLLLGCWFDERARRETDYREFVDLFRKGELPVQKVEHYFKSLNKEVECTESLDGHLLNGCIVGIAWGCSPRLFLSALPKSVPSSGQYEMPCMATGAVRPCLKAVSARSAIRIFRSLEDVMLFSYTCIGVFEHHVTPAVCKKREDQRIPDNVRLMHDECLVLCHAGSSRQLFLNFDSADPMPFRNVNWVECSSSHSLWKTAGKNTYISINSPVFIHHVASGNRLALDEKPIQSLLGVEHEVICTFEKQEPDTWRFTAPCELFLDRSEHRYLLGRNVWDILNERY